MELLHSLQVSTGMPTAGPWSLLLVGTWLVDWEMQAPNTLALKLANCTVAKASVHVAGLAWKATGRTDKKTAANTKTVTYLTLTMLLLTLTGIHCLCLPGAHCTWP